MRSEFPINFGWRFHPGDDIAYASESYDDRAWETVDIPHTLVELPLQYCNDRAVATVGWYRLRVELPPVTETDRMFLHFEAVAAFASVYIDGELAGTHKGAYTPFDITVPAHLRHGGSLMVAVRCDASERSEIPPFGHILDDQVHGGIYREVALVSHGSPGIGDVFVFCRDALDDAKRCVVTQTTLFCEGVHPPTAELVVHVADGGGTTVGRKGTSIVPNPVRVEIPIPQASLWDIDDPVLYSLKVDLLVHGTVADSRTVRFGFREARFASDGFHLNGKVRKLRGLNRHQSYPYVGYAMPASQQCNDADILKREFGVDIVRTSHCPQSPHFLDRCDEIGLLVFAELPGWRNVGGGAEWRELAVMQLHDMIERDRNHPSVVLWGVRVSESQDDDDLYARTNELARWLDPTRQTAGVRNFAGSHLLEDVYAYNDVVHNGITSALSAPRRITGCRRAPYLVTGHNGQMFPVRPGDGVEIRTEQALRHARVLDAMHADAGISGAIGWCMSDYYTQSYFGEEDQVCRYGVSDMFRIPKLATAAYASQQDRKPVMTVSFQPAVGSHRARRIGPVWVFTNCDRIEIRFRDEHAESFFPDRKIFRHLPHPPVLLDDFIGMWLRTLRGMGSRDRRLFYALWAATEKSGMHFPPDKKFAMGFLMRRHHLSLRAAVDLYERFVLAWDDGEWDWTFIGWKDARPVCSQTFRPVHKCTLRVHADRLDLHEGITYDVVRLVVRAQSETGQTLQFSGAPVHVAASGSVRLIGPSDIFLSGGSAGVYVRTRGRKGEAEVKVSSPGLGSDSVRLSVD